MLSQATKSERIMIMSLREKKGEMMEHFVRDIPSSSSQTQTEGEEQESQESYSHQEDKMDDDDGK